jgi:hypothetical protein
MSVDQSVPADIALFNRRGSQIGHCRHWGNEVCKADVSQSPAVRTLTTANLKFGRRRTLAPDRYCLQGLPLKVKVGVRFFSTLADIGAYLQAAL